MEKFIWTDRVRNEEVLYTVKEKRNIVHTIKRGKANWIERTLRRNYLPKYITERKTGGIKVTGTRRRRSKQLLYGFKEREDTVN